MNDEGKWKKGSLRLTVNGEQFKPYIKWQSAGHLIFPFTDYRLPITDYRLLLMVGQSEWNNTERKDQRSPYI